MNVIAKKSIEDFYKRHTDSKDPLLSWYHKTKKDIWGGSQDIKDQYPSASFLAKNRVIFNIKGNKYRLVTKIAYNTKTRQQGLSC